MPAKTRASSRSRRPPPSPPRPAAKALKANPFVALLGDVRRDVDTRLAGLLDARLEAVRPFGPEVVEMVRALRDLCLRGGKRLRAGLLVAGYRSVSATADLEPALDAAVAIEMLHAYLLIHDDWMDGDDIRRGGPAVHALLSRRFGSERLGAATAILAGDLGAALATEALSRVDIPPARLPRVLSAFAQMQCDAIAGQQLDVLGGADIEKTYELKTGSYTVAGPLRLGALLAGGPERLVTGLERVALPAGVAFQLRDDLLSAFGSTEETGKPFANDIRSGKRTLLVECARGMAKAKDRQTLESAFGNAKASPGELRRAVQVLEDCGARAVVEARIAALRQRSVDAVPSLGLSEARARLLRGAVEALTDRRS